MRTWYEINASGTGAIRVGIFDEIGGWGIYAEDFRREFESAVDSGREILIDMNSPGGDVFEGVAIYNTIVAHRERTTVRISGVAASIASVIALAGKDRIMGEGTFYMIHNPWSSPVGDAEMLRSRAATLDKIRDQMAGIYERNSSLSRETIIEAMNAETWYTPDEAFQSGFIQTIDIEGAAAASVFDWRSYRYRNVPRALAAKVHAEAPHTKRDLEHSLTLLGFPKKRAKEVAASAFDDGTAPRRDAVEYVNMIRQATLELTRTE